VKHMRYLHLDVVLCLIALLGACERTGTMQTLPPGPLSDGSYAVIAASPPTSWRDYVPGSRAAEERAAIEQLVSGLSDLELETMRKSVADLNVVATPNPEHARLFSILKSIRMDEAMAKGLVESRRAAEAYWPPVGIVVAPGLLPSGVTARLLRRVDHDPTNVILVSSSLTVAADIAVALAELRRLRVRDGDVLFVPDMEATFDVTVAMRSGAQYTEYPRKVLDALLLRAPKAPVGTVQGIGEYPVDTFRARSLSGRPPKIRS